MATQKSSQIFSLIPRRKLLALYTALLRCRMMEELAAGVSRRNQTGGHEASAVAVVLDLKPGDTIAAAERDFLPRFVNGTAPEAILSELRARPAYPRISFAATLQATLAAARIHAQRGNKNIATVFARDASVSSAAWRNALRTAGAERLPILFISQPAAEEAQGKAAAPSNSGFPAITVDGDDVVALYRVASEAQAHARRGNGPTLIECVGWPPALGHNGAHAATDSIFNMERYLAHMRIPFVQWKRKAIEDFGRSLRSVGASVRARVKAIGDQAAS